jgi:hypothetical protein
MLAPDRVLGSALVLVVALLAAGCSASSEQSSGSIQPSKRDRSYLAGSSDASPLSIFAAPTPRLPVRGYKTSGTFPQVRGEKLDLRAVNAGLRAAVLANQRAYLPYARRERRVLDQNHPNPGDFYRTGYYRIIIDHRLMSASTVVVSALLPLQRQAFQGQPGTPGWMSMTVRVPSGEPVGITDLFSRPGVGLGILARAWIAHLPGWARGCVTSLFLVEENRPTAENYGVFALTPEGLAVGVNHYHCHGLSAVVPYTALRPYLSKLGATLVAGVRPPR